MLSVCPLLLLLPPQATIPTAIDKSSTNEIAYPRRPVGMSLSPRRNMVRSKKAAIQTGAAGTRGLRCGTDGGARNDSVAVSVAVQKAVAVVVPAVGVHVTAAESVLLPFLNCTVPVGPAP
jgi:hypothetical protein